jgi:hypothetical protein
VAVGVFEVDCHLHPSRHLDHDILANFKAAVR